jgi:HEAT repeat protein
MRISLALALVGCVSISGLLASSMQPETPRPRYRPVMNEQRRKSLDQLKADLNSPDVEVRRRVLQQASQAISLTAEGRRLAEVCLKDADAGIRLMAAQRLVERRDADPHPDLLPVLLALLDHPEYEVWGVACGTVRQLGRRPQEAVPIFRRWLTHEDSRRRLSAVSALVGLGHPPREELPKLIAALPTARYIYAYQLTGAVASFGPQAKPALPLMAELLKKGEGINRDELASLMLGIDPACPEAFSYFVELLKDKDPYQRKRAAFRLVLRQTIKVG